MPLMPMTVVDESVMGAGDGTVWNSAFQLAFEAAITAALGSGAVIASAAVGAQHNWAPGLAGHTYIAWIGATALAVTGFTGGVAGQRVTIKNTGAAIATFVHNSGSSSAGNKLKNCATSAPTPVAPGGFITYQYKNGTDWQVVAHEQGAWITPTFAAGTYTGSGAMTWAVDAGDVVTHAYRLTGKTVEWVLYANPTTIGGTPAAGLQVAVPGGFVLTRAAIVAAYVINNAVGEAGGYVSTTVGASIVTVNRLGGVAWTAGTNVAGVFARLALEVD